MPSDIYLTDPFIRALTTEKESEEYYDNKMKSLAVRVYQSGHKSFVYRYRYGDSVKRFTIGSYPKIKLTDARSAVKELEKLLSNGIDPLEEKKRRKRAPKKIIVTELCDLYIEKHLPSLKESTQNDYKRRIKIIKEHIGDIPAKDIERIDVIEFLEEILEDGAPIQSNRLRAILSSIFSFGTNRGLLEYNLIKTIKPLATENKRDRVYNDDEIKILWKHFEYEDEPFQSVLKMLLLCGQRAGETRMAKWEHISDNNNWIIPAENTKANREQQIPLPPLAVQILNRLKEYSGDKTYVFASSREENAPISWLQNSTKRIRDMETCTVTDFRLHDLRRTVASNLAKLGVSRTVIGKTLNHKGIAGDSMVTAVYDRYEYMPEKKEALKKWNDYLKLILNLD